MTWMQFFAGLGMFGCAVVAIAIVLTAAALIWDWIIDRYSTHPRD